MGRRPCCAKVGMNRGAWTTQEDRILTEYIHVHGEGGWRNLPTQAGLKRCGKSCRLRWLNYLRPDIKRGNITPEEEVLIIELQEELGNRWSQIAGRLPGRTDNEIKNYWNTHLSKKVRSHPDVNSNKKSTPASPQSPPTPKNESRVVRAKVSRSTKVFFDDPQLDKVEPTIINEVPEENKAPEPQLPSDDFMEEICDLSDFLNSDFPDLSEFQYNTIQVDDSANYSNEISPSTSSNDQVGFDHRENFHQQYWTTDYNNEISPATSSNNQVGFHHQGKNLQQQQYWTTDSTESNCFQLDDLQSLATFLDSEED
ncbi:hypothetical protein GIB67_012786 [Kingdonia uniflora]|uniref:Uncharacterized protein n=1 Tax=Kingdonia uniflora TaxID=39325 RepID=A0A7J7NF77_9MAGN|nr:hypothetical protein GIB67_012786 [Kingdonia uniflora]